MRTCHISRNAVISLASFAYSKYGTGNVALDCARLLLSPIEDLEKTDITPYSLEAIKRSNIKRVHIIGRRGPVQVSQIGLPTSRSA